MRAVSTWLENSTIFARLAFPAAILRLATALLRTRYSPASSIFTRLNGRSGTSYDGERHYVPNLADAPHRRPTHPLLTQVRGKRSTLDTYSHVLPGMDGGIGGALEEPLG